MARTSDLGDGDPCPDGHGNMYVVSNNVQYCAHVSHDGHKDRPSTRKLWPLHGFEAERDKPATLPPIQLEDLTW